MRLGFEGSGLGFEALVLGFDWGSRSGAETHINYDTFGAKRPGGPWNPDVLRECPKYLIKYEKKPSAEEP